MTEIIKKSWSDITINDYKEILEIQNREYDSDLEKGIAVLSVLCEKSEDELYSIPITELNSLLSGISWMSEEFTFNKKWSSKHIKINDKKYDVICNINKFTVAQYADFQIYWDKRGDVNNMGKLLTVFIIPEGHKYNEGYDIVELANTLENWVSITDYNSICFFFLKVCALSIKESLFYSNFQMMKMIRKEKDKEKKKELKQLQKEIINKIVQMQ